MNPRVDRTPVSIITGFLGSGKTTLLNHLLQQPAMAGAAVIINEFGEIGLDHLLVTTPSENTVLLASGCLCCTVRGDLVETLADLYRKRRDREVPGFDRVVVETTGLADPVPIIQTAVTDGEIAPLYRLDAVVTLVDAVHGASQLDCHQESIKQVAVADRVLLTKTDLALRQEVDALRGRLARINPGAPVLEVAHGAIDPQELFGAGLEDAAAPGANITRWLREEAYAGADHHHDSSSRDVNRHDDNIRAFCIYHDRPVSVTGMTVWLEALAALRGTNLLRVKGLFNVDGRPVAVHAVQTLIHEPVELAAWPGEDRRSRAIFITRDMARGDVEKTFEALSLADMPRGPQQMIDPRAYAQFVSAMDKFR